MQCTCFVGVLELKPRLKFIATDLMQSQISLCKRLKMGYGIDFAQCLVEREKNKFDFYQLSYSGYRIFFDAHFWPFLLAEN